MGRHFADIRDEQAIGAVKNHFINNFKLPKSIGKIIAGNTGH